MRCALAFAPLLAAVAGGCSGSVELIDHQTSPGTTTSSTTTTSSSTTTTSSTTISDPLVWCHAYPPTEIDAVTQVSADAAGNVLFAAATPSLDGGPHRWTLAKFEPTGGLLWQRTFDTPLFTFAAGADGSVVFLGYLTGTTDLGKGPLVCPGDASCALLVTLAPDGSTRSAKVLTGVAPGAVAVSAGGEIAVGGSFSTSFDCGLGPLVPGNSAQDLFLARFAADGTCTWSAAGGSTMGAGVETLGFDAAGDLVVSGYFNDALPLTGSTAGAPGVAFFVAKLDPSGAPLFAHTWNARSNGFGAAAAVTAGGEVLASSVAFSPADLGGGPLATSAAGDLVIARYDASGALLWSHDFGNGSEEIVSGLQVDAAGNAWLLGSFHGVVDVGSGPLQAAGAREVFLGAYGPDGSGRGSRTLAGVYPGMEGVSGAILGVNAQGAPLVAGRFGGTIDLGAGPLVGGVGSVFLCQLPP